MTTSWTPERRAAHRAAIQNWKPWTKSTGPRSAEGKKRSSMNAFRNGGRTVHILRLKALLAHHRQWLRLVRAHLDHHIFSENELLAASYRPPQTGVLGDESLSAYAILRGKEP
jgi:hypothetical protein